MVLQSSSNFLFDLAEEGLINKALIEAVDHTAALVLSKLELGYIRDMSQYQSYRIKTHTQKFMGISLYHVY